MTDNAVTIERSFDAPVGLIWDMWTNPEHFASWYGPQGATVPVSKIDLRVGGKRQVCMEMQTPDGPMQMWLAGEYREIEVNSRLVFTEAMADPEGNVLDPAEAGMPEDHPAVTEVIVELSEAGGRTHMRMTHVGVPADSPGAMGWNMAFDKLEARVAAAA